jgi:hypothetical protein
MFQCIYKPYSFVLDLLCIEISLLVICHVASN